MKRTNMDLLVGGSILVALLIMIGSVLWLKEMSLTKATVQYTVLFPNVGTLQIGDPVMVNGVRKGFCADIYLYGTKVAVNIKIDRNVPVTDSSRVIVQNIGLMGERMVGVELSEKGTRYLPNKGKKIEQYINGYFDSGLAEAMGMMGNVLNQVEVLVADVQSIVNKTVGDSAFAAVFHSVVMRLDTISSEANILIAENKSKINTSLNNVEAISSDVRKMVDDNKAQVNTIAANGAELSSRAVKLSAQIEEITVSLNSILSTIDKGEGSVGKMLKDEALYSDLKRTVNTLDSLVNDVKSDGLPVTIKLFGSRNKRK